MYIRNMAEDFSISNEIALMEQRRATLLYEKGTIHDVLMRHQSHLLDYQERLITSCCFVLHNL